MQSVTMGKFTASGQLNSPLYFLSSLVCSLSLMATSLCSFLCVLGHIFSVAFRLQTRQDPKKKKGDTYSYSFHLINLREGLYFILFCYFIILFFW